MATYKDRKCQLCADKVSYIDYKNVALLRRYKTKYHKISPRYYNGNCLQHQRQVAKAMKNARYVGLLPYTV